MSYLQKYYVMAENELENRRNENKENQRRNIKIAEDKIPEIKELRKQLAIGGSKLSKILLLSKDAKQEISKISVENMEIKRKIKQMLIANGFSEDFLDLHYSCEKCKDTGIYEERRCSCFMNDVERFQCLDFNSSSALNLCSFDNFDLSYYPEIVEKEHNKTYRQIMEENFSACFEYAKHFHIPNQGLLMIGGTGLGKTHLSFSIGNAVIKNGFSVIYGSAPDLFRKIEKEHFDSSEEGDTAQLLQDCNLLIIDDLGAEFDSKFNQAALYNLLNTRMNKGLPLIVNTNFNLIELNNRYGGRILSRLLTLQLLTFYGEDIRIIKALNG